MTSTSTGFKKQPVPFGKYLLLDRINIGGMAEVWRGKSFGAGGFERLVAIKRILPNIAEDEEFITMFIDEAKISSQLNHANIGQIYELGNHANTYFIAMEYIPGRDMRAIFERCRKRAEMAPIPLTCFVVSKMCEGLDYAHRKKDGMGRDLNIVHRDVSPQNVLLSYEGEVKIIDFGIAKAANKATRTQAGILKGKFGYMSPEQIRGHLVDRRSDVFAIGVCLYEMLTGQRLFVGDSDFAVLEKVRKAEVPPPSTINKRVPEALDAIVLKALARDVEQRYAYASELGDDLQRFLITSDSLFSRKDLMQYMKSTFAEEVERERMRLQDYEAIEPSAEMLAALEKSAMVRPLASAAQLTPPAASKPSPVPPPSPSAAPPADAEIEPLTDTSIRRSPSLTALPKLTGMIPVAVPAPLPPAPAPAAPMAVGAVPAPASAAPAQLPPPPVAPVVKTPAPLKAVPVPAHMATVPGIEGDESEGATTLIDPSELGLRPDELLRPGGRLPPQVLSARIAAPDDEDGAYDKTSVPLTPSEVDTPRIAPPLTSMSSRRPLEDPGAGPRLTAVQRPRAVATPPLQSLGGSEESTHSVVTGGDQTNPTHDIPRDLGLERVHDGEEATRFEEHDSDAEDSLDLTPTNPAPAAAFRESRGVKRRPTAQVPPRESASRPLVPTPRVKTVQGELGELLGGNRARLLLIAAAAGALLLILVASVLAFSQPSLGYLYVDVNPRPLPSTVRVNVGGEELKDITWPLLRQMKAGPTVVMIAADGFEPAMQSFTVNPGTDPSRLTVELKKGGEGSSAVQDTP